jgi:hypothetical protein
MIECGHGRIKAPAAVFEWSFASNYNDCGIDADVQRWEDYYKSGAGAGNLDGRTGY